MSKEKDKKRERGARGAGPKASLVMTGFGTFAALILAFIIFYANRYISNNSGWLMQLLKLFGISADDSITTTIVSAIEEALTPELSEGLSTVFTILLIAGIWCLIFWIICLVSRTHRVRDIICTIIGRIPAIILAVAVFRIWRDLADAISSSEILTWLINIFDEVANVLNGLTAALGGAAAVMIIWIFLTILLSIFGWRKKVR